MLGLRTPYRSAIPSVVGLELLLGDNGSIVGNLAVVNRKKERVHFVSGEFNIVSVREICNYLPPKIPVSICVEGKGVIHRILPADPSLSDDGYLKRVISNAKYDDFYVQVFPWEQQVMVSIVRREVLDSLITDLQLGTIVLLGVSLGTFALTYFLDHIPVIQSGEKAVGMHAFSFAEKRLGKYRFRQPEEIDRVKVLDVGGEIMNEYLLAPFAQAYMTISGVDDFGIATFSATKEYQSRLALMRAGKRLVIFFITLLLVNAVVMYYYTKETSSFLDDIDAIQSEIDDLKQHIHIRNHVLGGLLQNDVHLWTVAYMSDRIAAELPDEVWLTELRIFPLDEPASRKERRPVQSTSSIRISGACPDVPHVNEWIQKLRTLPFCKTVDLVKYNYDDRQGFGLFTLNLTMGP